jgi:hypothetical protein
VLIKEVQQILQDAALFTQSVDKRSLADFAGYNPFHTGC